MGKQVAMPFLDEFKEVLLSKQKVMTSRTRKHGEPGDTFYAFGEPFKILAVNRMELEFVARNFFTEEGCENPESFRKIWKQIHPRKGYIGNQLVYVHTFRRI